MYKVWRLKQSKEPLSKVSVWSSSGWATMGHLETGPGEYRHMIPGFEKIVEERIRIAQKKGEFENLPNAGKPIMFSDNRFVPEELRLAYKVLKNADFVPPEIEIKKEILHVESLLSGMADTAEAYQLMKKLNFLVMKFNSLRGGRIAFEVPQHYEESLCQRFGTTHRSQAPDTGHRNGK